MLQSVTSMLRADYAERSGLPNESTAPWGPH